MTADPARLSVQPLFALSGALWLRIWVATQALALGIALWLHATERGARAPYAPTGAYVVVAVAALIAYHVVGYLGYDWFLRRNWATALFVPLGWVVVVATLRIGGGFSLLILGAIIQGFVFLPFAWAISVLGLVTIALVTGVLIQDKGHYTTISLARGAGVVTTAVMIGTVFLYIDRANRDSAIKARLLEQLEAAQRELTDRAREAGVQEERQRLARDIHDTLAQGFSSVIRHLEAVELSFGSAGAHDSELAASAIPHLEHAKRVSRDSLAEIRNLVWALRPAALERSTLPAALGRVAHQWSDASGIAVDARIDDIPPLVPDVEVLLLRALQESLSNVARHAVARHVAVSLSVADGLVMLSVEDDGRGFDDADLRRGMGVAGMRDRVRPFGGRVIVESDAGQGTSVMVALPLEAVAA